MAFLHRRCCRVGMRTLTPRGGFTSWLSTPSKVSVSAVCHPHTGKYMGPCDMMGLQARVGCTSLNPWKLLGPPLVGRCSGFGAGGGSLACHAPQYWLFKATLWLHRPTSVPWIAGLTALMSLTRPLITLCLRRPSRAPTLVPWKSPTG